MPSYSATGIFAFLFAILLAGCGPQKFDATNAQSAAQSFQGMTADMTETQRQEFMARATAVASLLSANAAGVATADSMWKGIHGLTKAEIEAKANELLPTKIVTPAQ